MINDTRDDSALNGFTIDFEPVPMDTELQLYRSIRAKIATTWSYYGLKDWERKYHTYMITKYNLDTLLG